MRFIALSLIVVLGALHTPVARAQTQPTPQKKESLTVTSNPSGADVEINGIWVGKTPVTVLTGPAGYSVSVVVKKDGFESWSIQSVSAPGENSLWADLKPRNDVVTGAQGQTSRPVTLTPAVGTTAPDNPKSLTNSAIIEMVKAGIPADIIVLKISGSDSHFDTDASALIALKQAGVPDEVIRAMVSPARKPAAQASVPASAVAAPAAAEGSLDLHDGTPLRLRLSRNLSSADAKVGETVDFEVLEEVKVDDLLLIARGATAIATVTQAQSKRRMARGGRLDVNIDYVRLVNGEKVALRAVKETSGGGHTGAMTGGIVATSIVFFPAAPFFLFMHGKDVSIPKGTEITAYVNGEIKLDRNAFLSHAK